MGLDIRVYSNLEMIEIPDFTEEEIAAGEEDKFFYNHLHLYSDPNFKFQQDEIKPGFYNFNIEPIAFKAGSYGGYNHFRSWLCENFLGPEEEVIKNPLHYEGKSFFELVFFSDCEGFIGPRTSWKLFNDFKIHHMDAKLRRQREGSGSEQDYMLLTYQNFMDAFELAAYKSGVVVFC